EKTPVEINVINRNEEIFFNIQLSLFLQMYKIIRKKIYIYS
ncbi:MAG: hypothetical protein K0S44_3377, partial [Bacteroidetes bacterium]|nr:hypothetical protein [Bacteroidota bacterium]